MAKNNGAQKEIDKITRQLNVLYEKLLEKRPSHFRKRDVVNAFFAAFLIGVVLIFKGRMIEISVNLTLSHLMMITVVTMVMITLEIYFVGYTRVSKKEKRIRPFGQFWAKRFVTFYMISVLVSLLLIYLYNINTLVETSYDVFKIVISVSMPCAVGAAMPSLLRQY